MFAKIAVITCLVAMARAGALLNAGYGSNGYGGYGGYGSYGGYGGYGGYAGYAGHGGYGGYSGYGAGGSAVSHVSVVKEISSPAVNYAHSYPSVGYGHSYAPAVSSVSQYRIHAPATGYASSAYGGYGYGNNYW
ncbi:prisilkin-39-like isoform X1 [Achroia grisella]|uniref:prisilkin-39-like isoform X1 n=1 Tax=Achroia grisella TaxID=688607 RepID=UPI0027D335A5|nr:prisilkin-39-like isoform X1 [Achroia grisella]